MANDINRVYLIGRLTRDPELTYTQGGTSKCNFSIANNKSYTVQNERKDAVSYFNIIAWGKPGEVIAQYVKKGQRIALEGRLQQRTWQDQSGQKRSVVEIVLETFQFIEKGERKEEQPEHEYIPPNASEDSDGAYQENFNEDDRLF